MPTVSLGATTVNYLHAGAGPGLVLVHGTALSGHTNWAPLIEALSSRYTIVAPDLAGSGATLDTGGPLTLPGLAAQVLAAADAAGLADFHLVGHSLGAVVAVQAAADAPQRVRSLVTQGGWVRTDPAMALQFDLWARLASTDPGALAGLLQLTAHAPAVLHSLDQATVADGVAAFTGLLEPVLDGVARQSALNATVDVTALLPRLTMPGLVISSRHDLIVPPRQQRELARRLPDAEYAEVDAGHAFPLEDPDLLVKLVSDFLDRVDHA